MIGCVSLWAIPPSLTETKGNLDDLLSRINASAPSIPSEPPRPFDFGDRSTFPVAPPLECAYEELTSAKHSNILLY